MCVCVFNIRRILLCLEFSEAYKMNVGSERNKRKSKTLSKHVSSAN